MVLISEAYWSFFSNPLIMVEINQYTSAPQNAAQKFETSNPRTILEVSQNMRAFIIKVNKPRVRILIGSVSNNKTGLTNALIRPKIITVISSDHVPEK